MLQGRYQLELNPTLSELGEGPYFLVAQYFDAVTLCRSDATARVLKALNGAQMGSWRMFGARLFDGLELTQHGLFEQPAFGKDEDQFGELGSKRKQIRVDWKVRFREFRTELPMFCSPFFGPEINHAMRSDEVAYFRCRLRTDILDAPCNHGVYFEVEVLQNPDNLSMAVVDFEAGGCSSVTFSPNTGAVIRERKVRESPRKVEGAYVQPLGMFPFGRRFLGFIGLYVYNGRLAFFRRCQARSEETGQTYLEPWESTGFITDLSWAQGRRLTPCLALRDAGEYRVRISRVRHLPPEAPPESEHQSASQGTTWSSLDWEAGPAALAEFGDA